jgi:hypothetical protein
MKKFNTGYETLRSTIFYLWCLISLAPVEAVRARRQIILSKTSRVLHAVPNIEQLPEPPRGRVGWPWTEEQPLARPHNEKFSLPRISIVTPSLTKVNSSRDNPFCSTRLSESRVFHHGQG